MSYALCGACLGVGGSGEEQSEGDQHHVQPDGQRADDDDGAEHVDAVTGLPVAPVLLTTPARCVHHTRH